MASPLYKSRPQSAFSYSVRTLVLVVTVISILLAAHVRERDPIKRMSVEELVEGLASKNGAPAKAHNSRGPLPADYNVEHQEHVRRCFDELMTRGTRSFPVLIDHLKDNRYSCMYHSHMGPGRYPQTVGSMCYMALYTQVRPCPTYLHIGGRPLGNARPIRIPYPDEARAWLDKRKFDSLLTIQREAWQESIDFVKSDEFGKRISRMQQATPESIQAERAEQLKLLTWCQSYLDKAQKPMRVRSNWQTHRWNEPMITAGATVLIEPAIQAQIGNIPQNATTGTSEE